MINIKVVSGKKNIKDYVKEDILDELPNVQYKGGHLKYPSKNTGLTKGTIGSLVLTDKKLYFLYYKGILNKIEWVIEMPFKDIIKEELSQKEGNRLSGATELGAMFATGGIIANRKLNFLSVPFKDIKGIKQNPIFGIGQNKQSQIFFSKFYDLL